MDMGGYGEFSTEKIRIWMDMDPAERGGVEWVSEFCPVKGSTSERGLSCAFIAGLPESVRQGLRTGCRVESMRLDDLLVRARAVLADRNARLYAEARSPATITPAPRTAVSGEHRGAAAVRVHEQRCFNCNGANHLARDCLLKRADTETRTAARCLSVVVRTFSAGVRKRSYLGPRRRAVSASLLSDRPVAEALPSAEITVDGMQVTALVDTGCTQCICHSSVCRQWQRRSVYVQTVNGQRMCCVGTGNVRIRVSEAMETEVDDLVVKDKPLAFILEMNAVPGLPGLHLS